MEKKFLSIQGDVYILFLYTRGDHFKEEKYLEEILIYTWRCILSHSQGVSEADALQQTNKLGLYLAHNTLTISSR